MARSIGEQNEVWAIIEREVFHCCCDSSFSQRPRGRPVCPPLRRQRGGSGAARPANQARSAQCDQLDRHVLAVSARRGGTVLVVRRQSGGDAAPAPTPLTRRSR